MKEKKYITVEDENVKDYLESDINIMDYKRVANLYNSYKTFHPLFEEYGQNQAKEMLKDYEDEIFTINNKILPDKKRIEMAFVNILSKNDREEIAESVEKLAKIYTDNNQIDYVKKKISSLEASLGIQNRFLLASYEAFEDTYRAILIRDYKKLSKKR